MSFFTLLLTFKTASKQVDATQITVPAGARIVERTDEFTVLESSRVLILDWDLFGDKDEDYEDYESGTATISDRSEVTELLEAYCQRIDKGRVRRSLWAVFHTFKGARGFRLDREFTTLDPKREEVVVRLQPDLKYIESSVERKHWAARVSAKPEREGEVIVFVGFVGKGNPTPVCWETLKLHQELLIQNGLTQETIESLEEALAQHQEPESEDYSRFYNSGYPVFR